MFRRVLLRQMETACTAAGLACVALHSWGHRPIMQPTNTHKLPKLANLTSSSSRPTSSLQLTGSREQHIRLSQPGMGHALHAMYSWLTKCAKSYSLAAPCQPQLQLPRPCDSRDGLGAGRHLLKAELGARRGCAGGSLQAGRQSRGTALVGAGQDNSAVAASSCKASWAIVLAGAPTLAAETAAESSGYSRALAPSPAGGSACGRVTGGWVRPAVGKLSRHGRGSGLEGQLAPSASKAVHLCRHAGDTGWQAQLAQHHPLHPPG